MVDDTNQDAQSFLQSNGYQPISVGKRLRAIRIERGLSIKSLAEMSGLAVNTLSLIENQKSSPSVNTLEQIAIALGIPITSLFEAPNPKNRDLVITKAGNRRTVKMEGICIEDCGLKLEDQPLQPFVVTLAPKQGNESKPITHTGHEFIYCLSGEIVYNINGKKYLINPGDSLFFRATLPHFWMNSNDAPAVYLLLMMPDNDPAMSSKAHFLSK